jgi:hypothetical protein
MRAEKKQRDVIGKDRQEVDDTEETEKIFLFVVNGPDTRKVFEREQDGKEPLEAS